LAEEIQNEVLEINDNTSNNPVQQENNLNQNIINNNVLHEIIEEPMFDNEDDFIDSGEEDLIEEDSDDDFGLESLSDLHILDLEGSNY